MYMYYLYEKGYITMMKNKNFVLEERFHLNSYVYTPIPSEFKCQLWGCNIKVDMISE